jgi:hypothetical protein
LGEEGGAGRDGGAGDEDVDVAGGLETREGSLETSCGIVASGADG